MKKNSIQSGRSTEKSIDNGVTLQGLLLATDVKYLVYALALQNKCDSGKLLYDILEANGVKKIEDLQKIVADGKLLVPKDRTWKEGFTAEYYGSNKSQYYNEKNINSMVDSAYSSQYQMGSFASSIHNEQVRQHQAANTLIGIVKSLFSGGFENKAGCPDSKDTDTLTKWLDQKNIQEQGILKSVIEAKEILLKDSDEKNKKIGNNIDPKYFTQYACFVSALWVLMKSDNVNVEKTFTEFLVSNFKAEGNILTPGAFTNPEEIVKRYLKGGKKVELIRDTNYKQSLGSESVHKAGVTSIVTHIGIDGMEKYHAINTQKVDGVFIGFDVSNRPRGANIYDLLKNSEGFSSFWYLKIK